MQAVPFVNVTCAVMLRVMLYRESVSEGAEDVEREKFSHPPARVVCGETKKL